MYPFNDGDGPFDRSDVVVPPNPLDLLSVQFVRDKHLRVPNYGIEDEYIERLIRTAYAAAERVTRRALLPQTRQLVRSCFPIDSYGGWYGYSFGYSLPGIFSRRWIKIPDPPLLEVTQVDYVDTSGETITIDPAEYKVSIPRGPRARRGYVVPNPITRPWPITTQQVPDAVLITFRAGYESPGSPPDGFSEFGSPGSPAHGSPVTLPQTDVPADITAGMLLMIGQLYKERSESIVGRGGPGVIRANDLWMGYRAY